ncbi:MAG: DUF2784 domain-containing protein [Gemmatimonadaceae bacterium]|nr:DUF2784 domain-containing protein [Gemmatimonadaceae bacterium]
MVFLARLVAFVHLVFTAWVVLGSAMVLRHPALLPLHLAAVAWAAWTMTSDGGCVLTSWEKALWRRAGQEPYPEGFLQHYVLSRVLARPASDRVHMVLGIAALVSNAIVYVGLMSTRR